VKSVLRCFAGPSAILLSFGRKIGWSGDTGEIHLAIFDTKLVEI
jgi:hypothetical protein